MNAPHYPVMLPEVLAALNPAPEDVVVDGTLGAGVIRRHLFAPGCTSCMV